MALIKDETQAANIAKASAVKTKFIPKPSCLLKVMLLPARTDGINAKDPAKGTSTSNRAKQFLNFSDILPAKNRRTARSVGTKTIDKSNKFVFITG